MSEQIEWAVGEIDGAFTLVYTQNDQPADDLNTLHVQVNRFFGGIDAYQGGIDHVRIPHEAIPALRRLLDDYDKYARTREVNGE